LTAHEKTHADQMRASDYTSFSADNTDEFTINDHWNNTYGELNIKHSHSNTCDKNCKLEYANDNKPKSVIKPF